jgi:transposase
MKISEEQYEQIKHVFPKQRGNVSLSNLQVINAMLYVAEHGCKWRGLPEYFGNWHTIYTRMNRWAKKGVLEKLFQELQEKQIVNIQLDAVSIDSTSIKVHPDGTGALKKSGPQSIGKSRGGWTTKLHLIAASASMAMIFTLSPGQAADGPEGRALLEKWAKDKPESVCNVLMDKAYEGDETRQLVFDLDLVPVVPPKSNRIEPWEYDKEMYKRRNEVERVFCRLKRFRRVFSRFEKLDLMLMGFIHFVFAMDMLNMC